MKANLTPLQVEQLNQRGISAEQLATYRENLIRGYPYITLAANCRLGHEIHHFSEKECNAYRARYQSRSHSKVLKFVPASGAASRMFKDLFASLESGKTNDATKRFFSELERFAFYEELIGELSNPKEIPLQDEIRTKEVLQALLSEGGLNYGHLPKGLISFHRYPDGQVRSAFEEHFHEAQQYASSGVEAYIHFTIPESSSIEVKNHLDELTSKLGQKLGLSFQIETSLQKPSTDTPAIYAEGLNWVLLDDERFLLRPAGHGALLENLNELDADLVFIKNIDNVVPDHLKATTVKYKEVIAGVLLTVQQQIFDLLQQLDSGSFRLDEARALFKKWFQMDVSGWDEAKLRTVLDRPVRVCGMVKNEGEPGGGPFVVQETDGSTSLQIVEKAQVDTSNPEQMAILNGASHFNPVDLVVSLRNYKGEPYNLLEFRNDQTGMVVSKSHMGKEIRALELPGLWNGSMHFWNTIFVEVPIETFNPVKTVLDLLRPAHQGA